MSPIMEDMLVTVEAVVIDATVLVVEVPVCLSSYESAA